MTINTEYPVVQFRYHITPEQEATSINYLDLPINGRAIHAMEREKIKTIGEILERWTSLHISRLPHNEKTNMGEKTIKEIRAAVFRWMLDEGCIIGLAMNTSDCVRRSSNDPN